MCVKVLALDNVPPRVASGSRNPNPTYSIPDCSSTSSGLIISTLPFPSSDTSLTSKVAGAPPEYAVSRLKVSPTSYKYPPF